MDTNDPFELWIPGADGQPVDVSSQQALNHAILLALRTSDAEVARVVTHLVDVGLFYQAARCLEIVAQHKLGLDFTGEELLNYEVMAFGSFHRVIYDMLRARAPYHRSG